MSGEKKVCGKSQQSEENNLKNEREGEE